MTGLIRLASCSTTDQAKITSVCCVFFIRIKEEKKGKPVAIMKDVKDEITHILMQGTTLGSALSLSLSY